MKISKKNKVQVNALQELLQKNYDAEKGYRQVMTKAKNKALKEWLQERAIARHYFATELDAQIRELNETPKEDSISMGTIHRAWIDTKVALSNNSNKALLEECIRGEKASSKEYTEQMREVNFDPSIKKILFTQRERIDKSLDTVKAIESTLR